MKTQILVYKQQDCGFTETSELTIREFGKAGAFDAFDLSVIDLQDGHFWKSDSNDDSILWDHADINSINQMILQSNKSKCIILLPQNCSYSYYFDYDSRVKARRYKHNKPLKDFIKDFSDSPIGDLFPLPLPICFGESKTILFGRELHSEFSFSTPIYPPIKPLLTSNASTVSAVRISETFAATTLQINNNDDLSAVIDAVFPIKVQPACAPDWLDEVEFHDEAA